MTPNQLLTAVRETRADDGTVTLPLRDGGTVKGRLMGCSASAVYLVGQRPVPLKDLKLP